MDSPIDLLTIQDKAERKEKFQQLSENAERNRRLLTAAYMALARKNQHPDFKSHSRFLKIFPQYFTTNVQDFYAETEIKTIRN